MWAQEEPKNMGYWSYVKPRIETSTGHNKIIRYKTFSLRELIPIASICYYYFVVIRYTGRSTAAAVATGSKYIHNNEQRSLINDALTI